MKITFLFVMVFLSASTFGQWNTTSNPPHIYNTNSTGRVGIGTSTTPATMLEVNGTISMVRGNRLQFLETVGGATRAFIEGDVNNQLKFHIGSGAGTDAMIITSAGKLGLGPLTPFHKFSIYDENNADMGIWTNHSSGEASIWFRNHATGRDGNIVYRSNGRVD